MRVNVFLKGAGSEEAIAMSNEKFDLRIKSGSLTFKIKNVLVVNDLALPIQCVDGKLVKLYLNRTGMHTSAYNIAPDMLFGQDNYKLIIIASSER